MALTWVKIGNLKGPKGDVGTWYQRGLTTADNLTTIPYGAYAIQAGATAVSFGLPNRTGVLEKLNFGVGYIIRFTTNTNAGAGDELEVWEQSTHGNGVLTDPSFRRTDRPSYGSGFYKQAAVPLTLPGANTDTRQSLQVRLPVCLGADFFRVRAHFRNFNYRSETAYTGQINFTGSAFGKHTMNPDGSMSGLFSETPVVLKTGFTGPADGSEVATDWKRFDGKAGEEYLLSFSYSTPVVQTNVLNSGVCFTSAILGAYNVVGPTTSVKQTFTPLDVWLEIEVNADTKVWVYYGDSLTVALNSENPVRDSWANKHALRHGAIATIQGFAGGSLQEWQDGVAEPALERFAALAKPSRWYNAMGYNDITNGTPYTGMQTRLASAAARARTYMGPNMVLCTILPNGTTTGQNTVRTAYNDWLKTLPENAIECLDMHALIVDPLTGLTDTRWSASAGDTHLNKAGYARMALASAQPAPLPPVSIDNTAGRTAFAWDSSNRRQQLIYGDTGLRQISAIPTDGMVFIRRVGNMITLTIRDLPIVSNETLLNLPAGFRPDYQPGYGHVGRSGTRVPVYLTLLGNAVSQNGSVAGTLYANLTFATNDPWPTTLPGTAIGTIPTI